MDMGYGPDKVIESLNCDIFMDSSFRRVVPLAGTRLEGRDRYSGGPGKLVVVSTPRPRLAKQSRKDVAIVAGESGVATAFLYRPPSNR